jgi:hypothetical protein
MEPIGAYRTVDGWAAYDRRGLAWRVSEAEARSLQRQHPDDHRQDDRARDEPDAE